MKSERSAELAAVKLRGLITEHLRSDSGGAVDLGQPHSFGAGAALVIAGEGWVYVPNAPAGTLGAAVAWSTQQSLLATNVVYDGGGGLAAFAAGGFVPPEPDIWRADGRTMTQVEAVPPHIPLPADCADLVSILREADIDVVADHGVWIGEVNGLEVARVGERDGTCGIDIGVGAYDQFASSSLDDDDPMSSVVRVVEAVRPHRVAGAAPHAIGRLVRSRWLRSQALREPALIGLDSLEPTPLLVPRPGLVENQPAAATGRRADEAVVVIFTVGIDIGVAETAAGLSALHRPDRVLVVAPRRDLHPRVVEAVGRVAPVASVVALEGEWAD